MMTAEFLLQQPLKNSHLTGYRRQCSGTVSGPRADQRGSFLELSWNGTEPIALAEGSTRTFLADGDTVTIRATAPGPAGATISLGEVTGTIQPPP